MEDGPEVQATKEVYEVLRIETRQLALEAPPIQDSFPHLHTTPKASFPGCRLISADVAEPRCLTSLSRLLSLSQVPPSRGVGMCERGVAKGGQR